MGELDDRLDALAQREQGGAADADLVPLLGAGWRTRSTPASALDVVRDFTSKLTSTSGQDAYWVDFGGGPTVHLPAPRRSLRGYNRDYARIARDHLRAEKRHRRGDARLLVVGDHWEKFPAWPFLRISGGPWTAATPLSNGGHDSWREDMSDWDRSKLVDFMVTYLRDGTFVEEHR